MINIAELLKNAPEGTELWFTLYGKVKLMSVNFYETYPIQIRLNDTTVEKLDKYGRFFDHYEDAECVLFPSRDCRTWEGWKVPVETKFKVGDWVVKKSGYTFYGGNYVEQITLIDVDEDGERIWLSSKTWVNDDDIRLWKIADAKDGDVLVSGIDNPFIYDGNIEFSSAGAYVGVSRNGRIRLDMFPSKAWTSIKDVKPATKEQRGLLFAKIREAGYEWDAEKKELCKIQPHYDVSNFHEGTPVLVRDGNCHEWRYVTFSHYRKVGTPFCAGGQYWYQCIPFGEGTKHLLGTTDMPSEEYINW